jgi:hypothetical protein
MPVDIDLLTQAGQLVRCVAILPRGFYTSTRQLSGGFGPARRLEFLGCLPNGEIPLPASGLSW